ncbi:MAG: hypothetical protein JXQ96_13680 [Cyclobacteriaceae bacterium]
MAKFITTNGSSYYIEQIIIDAKKSIVLVTPYLSISKNMIERLIDADKKRIKITLIYGKSELKDHEKNKLESLKNLNLFFCQNLHAKCYFNESSMVLTSMNLYAYSEKNNREMGVVIDRLIDAEIFNDAIKEVESIKNSSKQIKSKGPTTITKKSNFSFNSDLIHFDKEHSEMYDFYLPSLKRVLLSKYSDNKIEIIKVQDEEFDPEWDDLEDDIDYYYLRIDNFPFDGVELLVDSRIDFRFKNKSFYNSFKENHKKQLKDKFSKIRFYWNNKVLNIYPEKSFKYHNDLNGLNIIINKFFAIIEGTKEAIESAQKK